MKYLTLTNNWWMLIWIAAIGVLSTVVNVKRSEVVLGEKEYRWRWGPAIILALPYVIWAANRRNFGDTEVYIQRYKDVPSSIGQIGAYLLENDKDKGYSVLSIIFKSITGADHLLFFFLIAALQMFCLIYVYRKYSPSFYISMLLFVMSADYLSWMHNGMRQFIAVAIIFASFDLIVKKKYVPLICIVLLASTIHGSALIMIPIIFIIQGKPWNIKTISFIIAAMVLILLVDRFTPFLNDMLMDTQYNDIITNEIWTNDDGTNIIRVLVYSIPAIMSLIGIRYVKEANSPVINICVNGSIVSMALYLLSSVSSGIYMGRLPIYTSLMGYISLPWLIDNMFTKNSARVVKLIMIVAYFAYFYYQLFIIWA